jgi:Zn-dependent protease with chaperone function
MYGVHRLNGRKAIPPHRRLQVLIMVLFSAYITTQLRNPLAHAVTRYQERAADRYALEITGNPEALAEALSLSATINLEPQSHPGWAYFLWASHPSLENRLDFCRNWAEKGGKQPETRKK